MLDVQEITDTIQDLKNQKTTFETCQKLAILYTVLDHLDSAPSKVQTNEVVREYSDILPSYTSYCNIKRKYELNEISSETVKVAVKNLCQEIKEFLKIIYSNTDMELERVELRNMLNSLEFC